MGKYCKRIVLLFLLLFATNSYAVSPAILHGMSGGSGNTAVCAETYAPNLAADAELYIGRLEATDFYGALYKPATTQDVCQIDAYIRYITGTLTSDHDYYCRIFSIDGNDDVDAILGTSSKVDGDLMSAGTWVSANAGYFVFDTPVTLTGGTTYAITFFISRGDSDLTDNPEHDGTNYPMIGFDNENNIGDGISMGRGSWTWDSSIPYADEFAIDPEDDVLIKVWTQ